MQKALFSKKRTIHPALPGTAGKSSLWRNTVKSKTLLFMCLPAILFFVAFSYIPMPFSYIAFTKFNYIKGIFGSPFVGFKNFAFLFTSGQLTLLLRNTILFNLAFIVLGNFFQITFAILLNEVRSTRFKKLTQSMMFLPVLHLSCFSQSTGV